MLRSLSLVWSLSLLLVACGDYEGDGGSSIPFNPGGADAGAAPPPFADAGAAQDSGFLAEPEEPEDEVDNDQFEEVGTNPFVRTSYDPLSTFAADVDTASYDIFVRDIEDGLLPNRSSVRLEEYVNFFDYAYETPETGAEVPFAIYLELADHAMGRELAQLRVGIQAAAPAEFEKRPTHIVFLIDVSGSMNAADKLPLVQRLVNATAEELDPDDLVSIVSYAGSTSVRLSGVRAEDTQRIQREVNRLSSGGGTAGGAGIQLAYQQAEEHFIEGGFNHVVLCTDGDFNIGISDRDELVELIEEKRLTGVTLTAIGFGRGNLNDAMMERVSNAGNGIYSVMSSAAQVDRYAAEDILNTAQHVAQDMKIQVEFNPEHVVAYRLLGYENRAIADDDFRVDTVDAGEVGAGHRVTAIYELVLEGQSIPGGQNTPEILEGIERPGEREITPDELVRVKVRWKELGATPEDPADEVAVSLLPEDLLAAGDAGEDLRWAAAIAAFAEILKESPFADAADLDAIEAIVSAQAERDQDRAAFVGHLRRARTMMPTTSP
ncbi:MAG: von Willebrand factor type A domain-containing protein [Myxococcota bacterium]